MGATINSVLLSVCLAAISAWADSTEQLRKGAFEMLEKARTAYRQEQSPSNTIAFARACFDAADFAIGSSEREQLAKDGIGVSNRLIQEQPKLAAAHYYLAMNYGQLARTKQMGALKLVDNIEAALKKARELDAQIDFSGPDRCLGQLYRDAPGWPLSIGNKNKAREHLKIAVKAAPEYPDNVLNLVEAYIQWKEKPAARKELPLLLKAMEDGRKQLTGPNWSAAWRDWDLRLQQIKKELR